jgi:chitinase
MERKSFGDKLVQLESIEKGQYLSSMRFLTIFLIIQLSVAAETKLVGYLPSYRNLDVKKVELLTDLIFFSIEPLKDGNLKIDPMLITFLEKGKNIKHCRKFICIGGWGRSVHFKSISLNREIRKTFIDKVADFVKKYELDGIDYDWEHPKSAAEEKAYELLIKETSARGLKVSIAAAGWQKFSPDVFKHLYAVNIMSYDHPKEHSTLKMAKSDVTKFIQMGCPPEKINLGVPFYGRHIENRKAKSFNNIKVNDNVSDVVDGYYFNNIKTLSEKVEFVKSSKLSGIMIWEIEQDDEESTLLKALKKSLK